MTALLNIINVFTIIGITVTILTFSIIISIILGNVRSKIGRRNRGINRYLRIR